MVIRTFCIAENKKNPEHYQTPLRKRKEKEKCPFWCVLGTFLSVENPEQGSKFFFIKLEYQFYLKKKKKLFGRRSGFRIREFLKINCNEL